MSRLAAPLLAALLAALAVWPGGASALGVPVPGEDKGVTTEAIFNDPAAPAAGNPDGDVTIVAFFDYNCPYCKQATPALDRIVRADGRIRLVYKDWPILSPASMHGAQLALAAHFQGQYEKVHHALMGVPGRRATKERMTEAVKASGVDVARLEEDMKRRGPEILQLLQRHLDQAEALGLQGTPVFLVGPYKLSGAADDERFRQAVAAARAHKTR